MKLNFQVYTSNLKPWWFGFLVLFPHYCIWRLGLKSKCLGWV